MTFDEIERQIAKPGPAGDPVAAASRMVALGEAVLENWVTAQTRAPTRQTREGSRLLALHRQAAKGVPSFNACRETCREIAYHQNLIADDPDHPQIRRRLDMMRFLTQHLILFVGGKMEVEGLGEFCCSSRPLRISC